MPFPSQSTPRLTLIWISFPFEFNARPFKDYPHSHLISISKLHLTAIGIIIIIQGMFYELLQIHSAGRRPLVYLKELCRSYLSDESFELFASLNSHASQTTGFNDTFVQQHSNETPTQPSHRLQNIKKGKNGIVTNWCILLVWITEYIMNWQIAVAVVTF